MDERQPPHDRAAAAKAQEQGRHYLASLYALLRALKFYPIENETVQHALDELHTFTTGVLAEDGSLELRVVGEFFFVNETRLRLELTNYSTFGSIGKVFADHGLGEVTVFQGVRREEWAPFLSLLLRRPQGDDPYEAFMEGVEGAQLANLRFRPESEVHSPESEEEEKLQAAKRTYVRSVKVAKDVLTDVRLGRAVNVRKVKRAVQTIVDQVLSDEPSLLAMTTLRDFDEYTFTHSVNVCIFSLVIGQRLGLDKRQLYELGLGALFHDVGKMKIDSAIINKPRGLTDEEWGILKEHPTEGMLSLFEMKGFADIPYRQMLIAYEHHMKIDLTGYPQNKRPRMPALFSRIVAVADAFDAGTSIRSYQYEPWPADEVLREMRENPRRGFDPLLVRALINATGVFPVGTLVILDTLEMAVVSQANPDPEHLHQPRVVVISDAMGVPRPETYILDLSERDPVTGEPKRSIIKTTDPQKYGIRVSDFIT
ncbi:MAG: HD domain-containing protein [Gemmatimonadota bacterium]